MKLRSLIIGLLMLLLTTGCVLGDEVATNQVGVKLESNKIDEVVGSGVYWYWGWYDDLKVMNVDTLTFSVEDPEVLTKDNQAVSVKITIQARRKNDDESVHNIFTRWSSLTDDTNLINTISATAREGMKVGTRKFTLTQLLDERSDDAGGLGLAGEIRAAITEDAAKYSVELINVTVENIGASPEYMQILSQTANLNAEIEKARREQELINQKASNNVLEQEKRTEVANAQLEAEEAQTNVEVEIAERAGEVIAAANEVYSLNPEAFELERLRLLKEVLGENTIYLPSDVVLNLLRVENSNTPVLPLPIPSGE